MLYVVSVGPVSPAIAVPPLETVYQRKEPPEPVTEACGKPRPQCVPLVAVGAAGTGFTVTLTVEEAVQPDTPSVAVTV